MDEILGFLFIVIIIGSHFLRYWHTAQEQNKARLQLEKLVKQAGGKNINIQSDNDGSRGIFQFIICYTDLHGNQKQHHVTRTISYWGSQTGDFHWDKPLQMPEPMIDNRRLASKEQIISDMDAEIKRLQKELAQVKNSVR